MQSILHAIGSAILTGLLAIGSIFSPAIARPVAYQNANVGATIPVSTAVFQTSLSSGITSSATSMTLVNGTNAAGNSLSGYTCFNIDEGTSLEEFVCGTASGTSVTSMIRGIDPADGDLEVTALKKAHRRGASVKITDYPSIAILSRILNGDETIPNKITYATGFTFTAGNELVTKTYVDGVAISGGADASATTKGITKLSTGPVLSTSPIAVGDNDPRVSPVSLASITAGKVSALAGNNTDVAIGSGNTYVTQTGLQHNAERYAVDTGTATAFTITLSPAPTSYTAGMMVHMRAANTNTATAPTINVNSLGAKTIVKNANASLDPGDIAAGQVVTLIYNATSFQIASPTAVLNITSTSGVSAGPATSFTQTVTHNLGRIPKSIDLNGIGTVSGSVSDAFYSSSHGYYTSSGNTCVYIAGKTAGNGGSPVTSSSFAIYLDNGDGLGGASTNATGVVQNVTSTSFDIVWTNTGNISSQAFIWKAQ